MKIPRHDARDRHRLGSSVGRAVDGRSNNPLGSDGLSHLKSKVAEQFEVQADQSHFERSHATFGANKATRQRH